ncbi:DUF1659 domain-containing protein [Peptoniphilus mikwangii]|nr:DUF1659 domain-containing protein [Peptoniphilus mikwangii]
MAYTEKAFGAKLKIDFNGGKSANGKDLVKSKTFKNLNTEAAIENIADVADKLAGLVKFEKTAVKKIVEIEIV